MDNEYIYKFKLDLPLEGLPYVCMNLYLMATKGLDLRVNSPPKITGKEYDSVIFTSYYHDLYNKISQQLDEKDLDTYLKRIGVNPNSLSKKILQVKKNPEFEQS